MDVFLGGAGEGKRSSRVRVAEKFSQDERVPNIPVCVIYYMLSSGGFAASCLQAIAKGGSSILGRPGQTRAMFSGFDKPSTCSHSDDSGGTAVFVPSRTPRSSGYDFLCTCGLCCYVLYVYYMLYACYMSSSEPSSGNSDSVWIYRRTIFGQQRTGCARERHAPCIEGSFLVNKTGHACEHEHKYMGHEYKYMGHETTNWGGRGLGYMLLMLICVINHVTVKWWWNLGHSSVHC